MTWAMPVLGLLVGYALIGGLFGVCFVIAGLRHVDPSAVGRSAPWSFRLVILPGAAALWPWLLVRWLSAARKGRARP